MAYSDLKDPRNLAAKRRHYEANREQYRDRAIAAKQAMRDHVVAVKNVPCADCQQSFPPYVMDFDHRDPSQKTMGIPELIARGSMRLLIAEIAKCDVVCANCHRERTHGPLV